MGILFRFGGENVGAFNSRLTLYSGVPLDNTYEHTYTEQNKLKYSAYVSPAQPLYYIRPDKNRVRIQHDGNMKISNFPLYECNYLKFSNNSYEGVDFYCFVTEVRYINDDTAEIDFEVDVMMTWVASGLVTFEQCFVERETTNSDLIGEHILEEPVDIGDHLYINGFNSDLSFVIYVGIAGEYNGENGWEETIYTGTDAQSGYYIANALTYYVFNAKTGASINSPFSSLTALINSLKNGSKTDWVKNIYITPVGTKLVTVNRPSTIGSYSNIKNKKLLTYPYIGCCVTNYEGTVTDFGFEFSNNSDHQLQFEIMTSAIDGAASCNPLNYNKGDKLCLLTKTKYPVLSTSELNYSTYQAQLKAQMPADITSNVAIPAATGAMFGAGAGGIGGVAGAAIGGGIGLLSYVMKAFSGGEQAKLKGGSPIGANSGMLQATNGTLNFGFHIKVIRPDYAQAIDDFFTKFGYKVNRLKIPSKYTSGDVSQGGRTLSWHYIKTIGCALDGQAPASAVSKIQSIMDNGVTFWNKPEIGQYTFS